MAITLSAVEKANRSSPAFEEARTEIVRRKAGHKGTMSTPHLRHEADEDGPMIDLEAGKINRKGGIAGSVIYQHQGAKTTWFEAEQISSYSDMIPSNSS